MDKNQLYRSIPKVDVLLEDQVVSQAIEIYGRELVMEAIHTQLDMVRKKIGACQSLKEAENCLSDLPNDIVECTKRMTKPVMRKVVNATGTVLHTNLGRAPISKEHISHVAEIATGYSNLEYNLEEGKRGERYSHFEELLCKITGAEAAMAVNNNASAVMLILHALGGGGEVIVSRGELVEIGGKFRIPDVMALSKAKLVEIGTTNKTHFSDYENAITEQTKVLLKVHTSNYRIVGFTDSVPMADLVPLGKKYDIPVVEDLGSGVLLDLSKYGITYEPTVQDALRAGADVVSFSGDKLLGGPQAGIIVGKKKYIDMMKKNQLTRALRIDKFTATALEVVLMEYLSEERAIRHIPALRMITMKEEELQAKAKQLQARLKGMQLLAELGVEPCESQIGGGSLPLEKIPSYAVTIKPKNCSTAELEERLRKLQVPIIPRVQNDKIYIDVRTLLEDDEAYFEQLKGIL